METIWYNDIETISPQQETNNWDVFSSVPWVSVPKINWTTSIYNLPPTIITISDYESPEEWQPVVDRVLWWEFVVVRCFYTDYSNTFQFFFIPIEYQENYGIRFWCLYMWYKWFRITCFLTGTTVTNIWKAMWTLS